MEKKKTIVDIHNTISIGDLESVIKTQMQSILDNPETSSKLPPICIHGSPGIGKSKIVETVAKEMGVQFIPVMLAQIEPCDIKGLPVPNKEEHVMEWYVNGTWPRDPDSAGILFLDEITAIDKSIAVAVYELILERKLGNLYKLPKKWLIVSAGNLVTDRAVATVMPSALANRFMHFQLEANAEDWVKWAQFNDINPSVIGFIQYKPEYLFHMDGEVLSRGFPTPRSWERVSRMLDLYKDCSDSILRTIVYGNVGNRAGVEFLAFHKVSKEFDNVLEYMINPDKEIVIPDRSDMRYALVSTMNYLLWRGTDEEDENRRLNGFYRISMNLPADFAAMAMISAMAGNSKEMSPKCAAKLYHHPSFRDWSDKFGKALRRRIVI
jgi:hypothetical protein